MKAKVVASNDTCPDSYEALTCITEHPGFKDVCLSVWTLQAAYPGFAQSNSKASKRRIEKLSIERRYRYTAYRNFVRWIYGVLGKGVRVPLPACVAKAIVDAFPPEGSDIRTGFKYPPLQE